MTTLSVFIVTYNSAPLLPACLNSLRTQTIANDVEIIVVDNASRDNSAALVRSDYPDVKLIASDVNLGFGNANNKALAVAQGRYIVLLNPDATLPANTLENALKHMEQYPDVGMGGGLLQGDKGEWQPSARLFPSLNDALTLSGLANRYEKSQFFGRFDRSWADPLEAVAVDWVPGAFAIIRRDLIDSIGLFDPRFFLYYEEVDLCRRIHEAGFKVYYWPDLVITHIGGASSETVDGLAFSSSGKQLTLWRMRSQLLYYRKWHGWLYSYLVKGLEQTWHGLRAWRNAARNPVKAEESERIVTLWKQAWQDTEGGLNSPSQPW